MIGKCSSRSGVQSTSPSLPLMRPASSSNSRCIRAYSGTSERDFGVICSIVTRARTTYGGGGLGFVLIVVLIWFCSASFELQGSCRV